MEEKQLQSAVPFKQCRFARQCGCECRKFAGVSSVIECSSMCHFGLSIHRPIFRAWKQLASASNQMTNSLTDQLPEIDSETGEECMHALCIKWLFKMSMNDLYCILFSTYMWGFRHVCASVALMFDANQRNRIDCVCSLPVSIWVKTKWPNCLSSYETPEAK